jgi:hypothetical protein
MLSKKLLIKNLCLITFLVLLFLIGCNSNNKSSTEKIQKNRNKIVNVSDKIIDVKLDALFGNSALYILDDILIVMDKFPKGENGIHLFNKNTFKYITSTGKIGKGPHEIISPGPICLDSKNRVFWVPDAGKKQLFKFPLDSVLQNPEFMPIIQKRMDYSFLTSSIVNDSIVFGETAQATSNSSFEMKLAKLNINSEVLESFGYRHPKALRKKTFASFAVSVKQNFYVECHTRCDLMTICDLNGNLKYNIYGPGWLESDQDKNSYFYEVHLVGNNIVASYIGSRGLVVKGNITKGAAPSEFIIFDKEGNYLKTIEAGFEFEQFCIDEDNNRIIAYFPGREEPLGYFEIPF